MANSVLIEAKINKGFAKAATILGDSYQWYRPLGTTNPIVPTNFQGITKAAFANDKALKFRSPATFSTADTWYGFAQAEANIAPGDYLIGLQGTLFVTDVERFVSIHFVWCNRTISVGRPLATLNAGASTDYGGQEVNNLVPLISNWPASLRIPGNSGRARDAKMGLPTDALLQFYLLLLPPSVTTAFQWNDVVSDDLGRRYTVNGIEPTPLGVRLMLEMWPT